MNNFAINQALDRIQNNPIQKPVSNIPEKAFDNGGKDFASILQEKSEIKFSKHANSRLETRQIELNEDQMIRLNQAQIMASQKNIKNTLFFSWNRGTPDFSFVLLNY